MLTPIDNDGLQQALKAAGTRPDSLEENETPLTGEMPGPTPRQMMSKTPNYNKRRVPNQHMRNVLNQNAAPGTQDHSAVHQQSGIMSLGNHNNRYGIMSGSLAVSNE